MKRSPSASKLPATAARGSLACVGIGITLGSHLAPLARSCIETSDVVFAAVSDGIVEKWLETLHTDVRSLQPLYAEGKSRVATYREMVRAMMTEVRAGKKVCAAFYGHPGVFAWAPHKAIEIARREGFAAHMEPGISAEDCLYADLGIDPGAFGCQHFEASQLLYYKRRIDPSAYLVLWQAGVIGDQARARAATDNAYRQMLADRLAEDYPPGHGVIIYRAATLPIHAPRVERTTLRKLGSARIEPP
ncbi:MAG TPA: SAM-dependent methyltransferase, partial [Rudaea sp.]|nr:SAM-dependent methyltransferase [Rudaea sp.]